MRPISRTVTYFMRLLSNITFLIAVLAAAAACGGKNPIQPLPPPPPPQLQLSCPTAMIREATTSARDRCPFRRAGTRRAGASHTAFSAIRARAACSRLAKRRFAARPPMPTWRGHRVDSESRCAYPGRLRRRNSWHSATASRTAPCRWHRSSCSVRRIRTRSSSSRCCCERYPSQPIVVVNEGKGGEDTRGGARRLPQVLEADKPEVLLLLEGDQQPRRLHRDTGQRICEP